MSRGVLYIKWGNSPDIQRVWERSIASVNEWHPELPIHTAELGDNSTLLDKARMFELSPFDETLFLDTDTVVLGDISFGFEQAGLHGIACCICECPWARRYIGLQHRGDIVEYNTGVIFFSRESKPVFDAWNARRETINSAHHFDSNRGRECMALNDQASFAAAVADLNFNPYVLPMNWNFRKYWHRSVFGPIRIWHDMGDVTPSVRAWNQRHSEAGGIVSFGMVAV